MEERVEPSKRGPNDRNHTSRVRVAAEAGEKRKVFGFVSQRVTNVRVTPMGLLQTHNIGLPQKPTKEPSLARPGGGVVMEKGPGVPGGHRDGLCAPRGEGGGG